MKDIFETKKYLDIKYEDIQYKQKLNNLKIDILGKEETFKYKIKTYLLTLNSFFMSLMP